MSTTSVAYLLQLFIDELEEDEKAGLLLKYDMATLQEAVKVVKRVEDVRSGNL